MPKLEDLPLEEQVSMPTSFQRELKDRPESLRAENVTGPSGTCTRYFKRTNPNTGRTEWRALTGQPCGPPPAARPPPPPPAIAPPRPAPVAAPCTPAHIYTNWGAAYSVQFSNEPGSSWIVEAQRLLSTTSALCPGQASQITEEMNRVLRNFSGSLQLIPIEIAPLVDFYRRALLAPAARGAIRLR